MSPDVLHVESASDTEGRTLTGIDVPAKDLTATVEALETRTTPEPMPDRGPDGKFQAPQQKPDRPSRGSRRFEELDKAAKAEAERASKAERERDDLRQQLEALKAPAKGPDASPTVETPAPETTQPVFSKPQPKWEDFADDPDILTKLPAAMAAWAIEKHEFEHPVSAQIDQRIEADRAAARFEDRKREVAAAGSKAYPDFDAVLLAAKDGPTFKDGQLPLIATLDGSEHILYALAKMTNAERQEVINLDPVRFGMKIAQLIPARPVGEAASTARPVPQTNAPAPIQPVGAGTRTTSPSLQELAESGNAEAYSARRRQDLGLDGRR